MTEEFDPIQMISDQLSELEAIVLRADASKEFDFAQEQLKRWKERTATLLERHINPQEGDRLRKKQKGSFIMNAPQRNLVDEASMYDGFLRALRDEIFEHPDHILGGATLSPAAENAVPSVEVPESNRVFIIHGHDEINRLRLEKLLRERWGLDSLVLSDAPGKGRTIIEKFEEEAQEAGFAIAILTPDDVVAVADGQYAQPRPNVIFELGWFYSRLGRQRVVIMLGRGTELHSDLHGIERIPFGDDIRDGTSQLENELVAASVLSRQR